MARYRKIDTRIWSDAKFNELSHLKPSGQALFLYLLTARESTMLPGMMCISEAGLAERLGWSTRAFRKAWREIEHQGMAKADWKKQFVWLPKSINYNEPANPNIVKAWFKHYDELPECELRDAGLRNLYDFILTRSSEFRKAFEKAFGKALAKGSRKQEQEQEQKQKQPPPHSAEVDTSSDAPATAESSGGVDWVNQGKGEGGVAPVGRGGTEVDPMVDIPTVEEITEAVELVEEDRAHWPSEARSDPAPSSDISAAVDAPDTGTEPASEAIARTMVEALGVTIPAGPIDDDDREQSHDGCPVVERRWAVGRDLNDSPDHESLTRLDVDKALRGAGRLGKLYDASPLNATKPRWAVGRPLDSLPPKEPLTRLDIDKALRSRRLISVGQSDLAWRQLSQLHDKSPLTAEELIYALDLATKPNVEKALPYAAACVRKLRNGEATITQSSKRPEYIHQQVDRIKNCWLDLQRKHRYPKDESRAAREAERGLPGKDDVERYRRNAGSYERMDAEENMKRVQGLQGILASLGEAMSMST